MTPFQMPGLTADPPQRLAPLHGGGSQFLEWPPGACPRERQGHLEAKGPRGTKKLFLSSSNLGGLAPFFGPV